MKLGRRDAEAIVRENAQLQAENTILRAENVDLRLRSEKLLASCQVMIDELAGTTLEHRAEDGTVRRGRFFDVLAFDEMQRAVGTDSGGRPHVQ